MAIARSEPRSDSAATPSLAGAERRRHRRHAVALIARVGETRDGGDRGVITSLSGGGAFVQAETLPSAGARVWLEFGLAAGLGRFHGRARVVRINRRDGAEIVYGFGVEFDEPPDELVLKLDELAHRHREVARLDALGYLDWPVHPTADLPVPDKSVGSLELRTARGWKELAAAHSPAGGDGQHASALLRLAQPAIERETRTSSLVLGYRGRLLGPTTGIPRDELLEELEPGAPRVTLWARTVEAQLRVIDLMEAIEWRLEHLGAQHRDALNFVRQMVADARRALAAKREASGSAEAAGEPAVPSALANLDRLLAALDALVGGLLVTLEALTAPDVEWRPASAVRPEPRGPSPIRRAEAWLHAVQANVQAWPIQRRIAALLLATVIGGSAGYVAYAPSQVAVVNHRETLPIDTETLKRHVPVQSVHVEGDRVILEVPQSWTETSAETRRSSLMAACWSLGAARYTEAVVRTTAHRDVARWRGGVVEILG